MHDGEENFLDAFISTVVSHEVEKILAQALAFFQKDDSRIADKESGQVDDDGPEPLFICYLCKLPLKVKARSAEGSSCCKLKEGEMDDCQLSISILCEELKDAEGFDEVKGDLDWFTKNLTLEASSQMFDIVDQPPYCSKVL